LPEAGRALGAFAAYLQGLLLGRSDLMVSQSIFEMTSTLVMRLMLMTGCITMAVVMKYPKAKQILIRWKETMQSYAIISLAWDVVHDVFLVAPRLWTGPLNFLSIVSIGDSY